MNNFGLNCVNPLKVRKDKDLFFGFEFEKEMIKQFH